MKQQIFNMVSVAALLAAPASGSLVRGTVSDSLTGAPLNGVKVVLSLTMGEMSLPLDSLITGPTGAYGFPGHTGRQFYLYTIAADCYFHSETIGIVGDNDTITVNIKLKRIHTMVSAAHVPDAFQRVAVRAARSRLFLSGIPSDAAVDIYGLNGRLLLRTVVPAGSPIVNLPESVFRAGRNFVASVSMKNSAVYRMVTLQATNWHN